MAQRCAYVDLWPQFGLQIEAGFLDIARAFGRDAECFLEIGFGFGQSLLALAKAHPHKNFIGVETHTPGIGALFLNMQMEQVDNIRVYAGDAVDVLQQCILDVSLDGIQIFFPDPWPKRRHHPRRLIQKEFINLILPKLKPGGLLHMATDWEDYAQQMLRTLMMEVQLVNLAPATFAKRSLHRPIPTKFERRAEVQGRSVWDLQFKKV